MAASHARRYTTVVAAAASVFAAASPVLAELRSATQIAVTNQLTPDQPGTGSVFFLDTSDGPGITMNANGDVLFTAKLGGTVVTADDYTGEGAYKDDQGIYLFSALTQTLTKVARRNDLAPRDVDWAYAGDPRGDAWYGGANATATSAFSTFLRGGSLTLDDAGNVGFSALINDANFAISSTNKNDIAIYQGAPGALELIAWRSGPLPASATITGATAPIFGHPTSSTTPMGNSMASLDGKIAFVSEITDGAAGIGKAVFLGSSYGDLATVAYGHATNGTPIPGTGAIVTGMSIFENVRLTKRGDDTYVMFRADLKEGGVTNNALLIGRSSADLTILARKGDVSPLGDGINYNVIDTSTTSPNRELAGNYAAFTATVSGTGVATTGALANDKALFLADQSNVVRTVVRRGDPVATQPPADGLTLPLLYNTISDIRLSSSGWVAFFAEARQTGATSSYSYSDGIYLARVLPDGTPEVRTVAMDRNSDIFSQAAIHVERGDFDWQLDNWFGTDDKLDALTVNSRGDVIFFAGAAVAGDIIGTQEGIHFYHPTLNRAFRVLNIGDEMMVDEDGAGPGLPVAKAVTSISNASFQGTGNQTTWFNDDRQLVLNAGFQDDTEGIFVLDVNDVLPATFSVWKADAADTNWGAAGNWNSLDSDGLPIITTPNGGPSAPAYAEFSGGVTAPLTVAVLGQQSVGEIYFDTQHKVTVSGGTLKFDGVQNRGYIGLAQGAHEITSDIVADDTFSVITDADSSLVLSGAISGSGGLRKGGPGTLQLTQTNSYLGDTVIRAGYLEVTDTTQLGAATNDIVLDGGVLRYLAPTTEARDIKVTNATRKDSDMKGGIDTGANDVTLSGSMTHNLQDPGFTSSSFGFLYKWGAGKLTMALASGGPSGMEINQGSVEVTTPQVWGADPVRVEPGTSLTVTSTGSLLGPVSAETQSIAGPQFATDYDAVGGTSSITFDGPVTASSLSIDGGTTVTINAPAQFNKLTSVAANSVLNITANTAVTSIVSGTGSLSQGELTLGTGSLTNNATLSGRLVTIKGPFTVAAGSTLIQYGVGASDDLEIDSTGSLILNGSATVAGDLRVGGPMDLSPGVAITIGDDLIVDETGVLNVSAPISVDQVQVTTQGTLNIAAGTTVNANTFLHTGTNQTTGSAVNLNGTLQTAAGFQFDAYKGAITVNGLADIGTQLWFDATYNEIQDITINNGGQVTSDTLAMSMVTQYLRTPAQTLTIAAGGSLTTGAVELKTHRTTTGSAANTLTGTMTINVGGLLDAGDVVIKSYEDLADKNNSTLSLNVQAGGVVKFASLRHEAKLGTEFLPVPNIITEVVNIAGTLEIKSSGMTNAGTSVLANVPVFSGTGQMNLNDNALILKAATQAAAEDAIESAFAGGAWTGPGFVSSVVKDDLTGLLGMAAVRYGDLGNAATAYRGQPVSADDVIVTAWAYGDTNLDAVVDGADYFRLDRGYLEGLSGWVNGDYDYNGVNGDDFFRTDRAFLMQGSLPALGAAAVPEPASLMMLGLGAVSLLMRRRRA